MYIYIYLPGGGHDNPLQHSSLENPMDGRAWGFWSIGLQSQTQLQKLSTHIHVHISFCC